MMNVNMATSVALQHENQLVGAQCGVCSLAGQFVLRYYRYIRVCGKSEEFSPEAIVCAKDS